MKRAVLAVAGIVGLLGMMAPAAWGAKATAPTISNVACSVTYNGAGSYTTTMSAQISTGVKDPLIWGTSNAGGTGIGTYLAKTKGTNTWTATSTDSWYFAQMTSLSGTWHGQYDTWSFTAVICS